MSNTPPARRLRIIHQSFCGFRVAKNPTQRVHTRRARLSLRLDRAPKVEERFSNRGGEPQDERELPEAEATRCGYCCEAAVQRKAAVTSGRKNNEL